MCPRKRGKKHLFIVRHSCSVEVPLRMQRVDPLCEGFRKSVTSEHPRGSLKDLGGHQAFKICLDIEPCNSRGSMVLT